MLEKITKVVLKDAMKSAADVAKEAGPLSKEARQLRKLEKLGAVPVRDFENLQKAVKAQKKISMRLQILSLDQYWEVSRQLLIKQLRMKLRHLIISNL